MQQQAPEDVRQLGGGPAHQRQGRDVGLDPYPGGIGLRPGHLHRSGEDGGEIERIARAVAPPASEVLESGDDAGGVARHARQHVERAACAGELGIGAQGGYPKRDHVQRVIQVVCHARGQYAHGVHPLFMQERLALALQLALAPCLRGDVVDHGDRLATLQALEPHLDDLPLALEHRQVGNRRQGRRLAANQLGEARIPHPRMRSAEPAPRSPAGV